MCNNQQIAFIRNKPSAPGWLAGLVLAFLLTLPVPARAAIYSYDYSVNMAIPDGSLMGVAQSVTISGIPDGDATNNGNITNVRVRLNISGGHNGDLYAYLTLRSADGSLTTAILLNRVGRTDASGFGSSVSGFSNITLTGTAGYSNIHDVLPVGGGTYLADGRAISPFGNFSGATATAGLEVLNGHNANGTWTLFLADVAGGDRSTLVSWGLDIVANPAVFPVEAYGAVANDAGDDGPAIRSAIQAAMAYGSNSVVAFQSGNYRIAHDDRVGYNTNFCININFAINLTLQGSGANGTKLIVTDPLTGGLLLAYCTNCVVRGITIDYDPIPFTQGTITNVNTTGHTFDLNLHDGYPSLGEARFTNAPIRWGMIMDPVRRQPKADVASFVPVSSLSLVTGRTYRITPTNPNNVNQVTAGDRFVYVARNGGTCIHFSGGVNCVVEDVTVHTGPGAGIGSQTGSGLKIRRFSLSFPTNSDRLITTASDGFHCQQNRVGPVVADSYFEGMADDTMNIYCPPNAVFQVNSATSIVVGKTTLMRSGDRIQVFDPATGTIRGETVATNVSIINVTNYLLALAAPVPGMVVGTNAASADCIYDLDASGEGYLITNNVMKGLRGHGARLRAGNGLMVSNRITEVSFPGILIGNTHGPVFYEGPLGSNIVIRGNTIQGVGYAASVHEAAIKIDVVKNNNLPAAGYGLRHIVIEGNLFTNWPQSAISARAVTNLQVLNNQINSSAADNSYAGDIRGIKFDQCTAIVVSGTIITDPRTNLQAGIHVLNTVATGTAGFSTNNLTFNLAFGRTNILDERPAGPPNAPPSIAAIPTQTIMAGSNLVLSISATPLPLYFNLFSAPAGAALDQLGGVFTWRPTIAQSGTTNPVVVEVQDHGSPNLSATQAFQIIVSRPAQPAMSSVGYDNGQFRLSISGPAGLDYILQTTTNLSNPDWVGLWTNHAAAPPLVFTNTPSPNAARQFYRVLLGP